MILIINGSVGVGKTSTAEALHRKFEKSVNLDGDYIGFVHPFEIYDDTRIDRLYRTLALLVRFYQGEGYQNFVINYVFEAPESLQALLDLLSALDPDIHTFWLTCAPEEQRRRILARSSDDHDWELQRFPELNAIQQAAAARGFIGRQVDTTGKTPAEVVDSIWSQLSKNKSEELWK